MGQMVLIDEEELKDLKFCKAWLEEYTQVLNSCGEEIYPEVNYWLDTGITAQVNLEILLRMKKDLLKKKKLFLFKDNCK